MASAEQIMVETYLTSINALSLTEMTIARAVQKIGESTSAEEPWPLLVEAVDLIDEAITRRVTEETAASIAEEMVDHDWGGDDEDDDEDPDWDEDGGDPPVGSVGEVFERLAERFQNILGEAGQTEPKAEGNGMTWDDMSNWVESESVSSRLSTQANFFYVMFEEAERGELDYQAGYAAGVRALSMKFLNPNRSYDDVLWDFRVARGFVHSIAEGDQDPVFEKLTEEEKQWSNGYDDGYGDALEALSEVI